MIRRFHPLAGPDSWRWRPAGLGRDAPVEAWFESGRCRSSFLVRRPDLPRATERVDHALPNWLMASWLIPLSMWRTVSKTSWTTLFVAC